MNDHPAFAIRNAVAHRCNALGLEFDDRNACENAALDLYWCTAASNARCIAVGVELAKKLAPRRINAPEFEKALRSDSFVQAIAESEVGELA